MLLSLSSKGELAILTKPRYLRHSLFLGTLARMPLEGGAPREIADSVREADWNPDGTDLAISRDVNGKDRIEFPMGKVLAETGGYFSNPRFSPKGDRIAFFEHPFKFDDRGNVAVVDLAGKKTVLSQGYGVLEGLAWSRDGREILFSGGTDYFSLEVFGVGLDGKRRSAAQSAGGITILDVAPDGRWLTSRDENWRDILALAPGADKERNLSWLELGYPAALTPDGRTLLFTEESTRAGKRYSTCLRQTDGSPVVRLGDGAAFDISRDGKLVLSSLPSDPGELVVYPTGAGQPRKIERGGIVVFEDGRFVPDGRRVVVSGHEAGRATRCYVQDLAGGPPRPITPEGTSNVFVSSDGAQALVRDSTGALVIYPVSGADAGTAAPPVRGTSPDDYPAGWMSDGKSILVINRWWEVPGKIQKVDLATGRRDDVVTLRPGELTGAVQVIQPVFSADAKSYAYAVRRMASHLFLVGKGE
jgi:Tol biopolymer transport system component